MMKRILLSIVAMGWLSASYADDQPALVIQVPQTYYEHPTRIFHPRIDYWHNRGQSAEEVGVAAFKANQINTSSCKADANGQALVVILPNVSHNLQMGMYHTDITAKVYTSPTAEGALGEPVATVKGQGQIRGWVSYNSDSFIQKAYRQAFDTVIAQLQKEMAFQQAIKGPVQNYKALCDSVNALVQ